MAISLVGLLVVCVALLAWFFIPGKPLPKLLDAPDAVAHALEYLRDRGLEGGELRIQAKHDVRMTVVVTKHIVEPDNIELLGAVSDEAMRPGGYEEVEEALARRGIRCGESNLDGRRMLRLRVRGNLADLEVFVATAMELGFGIAVKSGSVAYFKNVLLRNMPRVTGVTQTT